MAPVAMDSPLRRSDVHQVRGTPVQTPLITQNDDEAEREARRSTSRTPGGSDESTLVDSENLKHCLQLYTDNKLSKENAWSVSIIDNFTNLIAKHHKSLRNFQVAGSSLEASARVYALRVDSLHTDTLRMTSELGRQTAKAMGGGRDDADDSMMDDGAGGGGDKENDQPREAAAAPVKKKRQRKHISTITKNVETINARLETNPFTDPFFAKLNSIPGDINSSNRLMQNMMATKDGELRLRMEYPAWDSSDAKPLAAEENYDDVPFIVAQLPDMSASTKLHKHLHGYRISDQPAEADEDETFAELNASRSLNGTQIAEHFDMNAECEPIVEQTEYVIDYGGGGSNDGDEGSGGGGPDAFDELTEEDRMAILACRGLKRKTVVVEDLRPIDCSSSRLEYSYRPLDNISQFWAGPSYWKIKRTRSSVKQSLGAGLHNLDELAVDHEQPQRQTKRRAPRKKKITEFTLQNVLDTDLSGFVRRNLTRPLAHTTLPRNTITKKWSAKKNRLPTDLKLDRGMFYVYKYAPGVPVTSTEPVSAVAVPANDAYNYANAEDKEYCNERPINPDTDTETEGAGGTHASFGSGGAEDEGAAGEDDFPPPLTTSLPDAAAAVNATINPDGTLLDGFIPTEFAGAPDKVEKIHLPFARRAKPINMKLLKHACWKLMHDEQRLEEVVAANARPETPAEKKPVAHFKRIFDQLFTTLPKPMNENVSVGLAVYSVLHLANERELELQSQDDLEDFTIILPSPESNL